VVLTAKAVACVNILPGVESHYWWKGKLEKGRELLLLMKTRQGRLNELERLVRRSTIRTKPRVRGHRAESRQPGVPRLDRRKRRSLIGRRPRQEAGVWGGTGHTRRHHDLAFRVSFLARGRIGHRNRADGWCDDWPVALGDSGQRHYSALSQVHTGNVDRLRVAWTYRSGDGSPQNRSQIQCNPVIVEGCYTAPHPC
jgi:hypothetical protein